MKKQVALFFGSFNPIHVGHLIIANTILQQTDLDQVWFVVSPQNPFKNKSSLLEEAVRLELVDLAIADNHHFRSSNVEFNLPKPSYTIDTLKYLEERHKNYYHFHLIMGTDNLQHFHKWKNYEQILKHHNIYAYNRPGSEETQFHTHPKVTIVDGPLLHISASIVRGYLQENKSVKYLVTEPVLELLEKFGYYK